MYKFKTTYEKILADTITPVSVYLNLRDRYPNTILLESSDYHANENSFSYICCNPIGSIKIQNDTIYTTFPNIEEKSTPITKSVNVVNEIEKFSKAFSNEPNDFKFINNGLFGFMSYESVQYFDNLSLRKKESLDIPICYYAVYKNVIAINHFKNEAYIFCHSLDETSNLAKITEFMRLKTFSTFKFARTDKKFSNFTDNDFSAIVNKAKEHCLRGDVFQLVVSRRFSQKFKGDDFNVYRALRSVNPSPYLFYFDYGDFKIFGSSPEAQLVVNGKRAEIHPIAGTFRRTGDDKQDARIAKKLFKDEKENAEHVMLVDLARNDLSRHGYDVKVEKYCEVQFFSHVIHLVSKVTAKIFKNTSSMQIFADTFPAGTLSGAPKYRAMQLIDEMENKCRNFYAGAIGVMDFDGNFNHAIVIRSFLSKNYQLYYQAGAGVVSKSNPESELQEVYNKLMALDKALEIAERI